MLTDVRRFMTHLDADRVRDQLLDAIHLERRRSAISKLVTATSFFGLGALVGGLAATAAFTMSPRLRRVAKDAKEDMDRATSGASTASTSQARRDEERSGEGAGYRRDGVAPS